MESPGEYLKRERVLRGGALGNISRVTRIPLKYLEALEADNFEVLPNPAFVKGFIKSYCKHLGLDETDAVLRYEMYLRERSEREDLERKPQSSGFKFPQMSNNAIISALVAFGVLVIVVFYLAGSSGDKPVEQKAGQTVQSVETPAQAPAQQVSQTPEQAALPEQQAAPVVQQPAPAAAPSQQQALPKPVLQETPGQPATPPAQKAVQKPIENKAAPVVTAPAPAPAKPAPGPAPSQQTAPATAPSTNAAPAPGAAQAPAAEIQKKNTLVISAFEMTWVMIKADENEPFDIVLQGGESAVYKAEKGFSLTIGNAGGVRVIFNGKSFENLGQPGQVVRLKLPEEAA